MKNKTENKTKDKRNNMENKIKKKFTMGKLAIILAIICVASWTLASVFFFAAFGSSYDFTRHLNYSEDFQKISTQGASQIEINSASENVIIEQTKGTELELNLTGYYDGKEEYLPELSVVSENGKITANIDKKTNWEWWFNIQSFELHVGIPANYKGNIKVVTSSGEITGQNLNMGIISLSTSSGNINIEDSTLQDLDAKTSSGDIKVADSRITDLLSLNRIIANLYLESSSGNIQVENISANTIGIRSISGNVNTIDSGNITNVKTTSGDIQINNNARQEKDLIIKTSSGNVGINLTPDSSPDVAFESSSGTLHNSFGDIYNGTTRINVKTSSGDFTIR